MVWKIVIPFSLLGCIYFCYLQVRPCEKNPSYYLDQENKKFFKEVCSEYTLYPLYSSQMLGGSISNLELNFINREDQTVEEAGTLIRELFGRYMKFINTSKELNPYLSIHPFPSEKIEISISYPDVYLTYPRLDNLGKVTLSENKIEYSTYILEKSSVGGKYKKIKKTFLVESVLK